jgi:hypothetical protein
MTLGFYSPKPHEKVYISLSFFVTNVAMAQQNTLEGGIYLQKFEPHD